MSWYELHLDMDDNGTFLVTAPAFEEVTTFGEDVAASLSNGREAIEEAIAARIARNEDIPLPIKDGKGPQYAVQVPMLVVLKAGLYMICRGHKVSRAELARRLGWHREQVDRLFRLDHNSRLDQIESAFRAVDVELQISVPEFNEAA